MKWFKVWHDMPTSLNWPVVVDIVETDWDASMGSPASVSDVIAVVLMLFKEASKADDRGSIEAFKIRHAASYLCCSPLKIKAIIQALNHEEVLFLKDGRIAKWEEYQEDISRDNAAERKRKSRSKSVTRCDTTVTDRDCHTLDGDVEGDEEKKVAPRKRGAHAKGARKPARGYMIGGGVKDEDAVYIGKVIKLDQKGFDSLKAWLKVDVGAGKLKAALDRCDAWYDAADDWDAKKAWARLCEQTRSRLEQLDKDGRKGQGAHPDAWEEAEAEARNA